MSRVQGTQPEQYAAELQGVHLTARDDNNKAFGKGQQVGTILTSLADLYTFLKSHELVKQNFDLKSIVGNDVVQEAM